MDKENLITGASLGAAFLSALTFSHNLYIREKVQNENESLKKQIQEQGNEIKQLNSQFETLQKSSTERQTVVFSSPEFSQQADKIVQAGGAHFVRGTISWKTFEDGFPNLMIDDVTLIKNNHVVFLMSCRNHKMLLSQLAVMFAFPRYLAYSCMYLIPWFGTATMERVDEEGTVATAQTLSRLLSMVPHTESGPAKIMIYDIHTLQNRFYFGDNVLPILVSAIPLFVERILTPLTKKGSNVVIVFPDDGAQKRFGPKFKNYDQIVCAKVRSASDPNAREITIKDGKEHVNQKNHLVILDDLVQSGGTLVECFSVLKKHDAGKVSCYVTHAIFPNMNIAKVKDAGFEKIWITNTCPETAKSLATEPPFEILDLTDNMCENILHYQ